MLKLKLSFAAVALLLVAAARGEWAVTSSQTEPAAAAGVEHRRAIVTESASGTEATVDLALFSNKTATLRVIDDPTGQGSLASLMQREGCIAGVNGGYFDPNDAPVGLLISEGRKVAPLTRARLLSGVVSVANGRVQIQRSADFSMKTKPSAARQCGPFLLERGRPIAGLNGTRSARRTFVLSGLGDKVAIGFCSYVTLAQLGEILATPGVAGEVKIQRALNLDGGSSSGFWFAGKASVVSIREQKRVRDYLAVVPR